jgi:two-component system, LuxR family, response regulator FixJ
MPEPTVYLIDDDSSVLRSLVFLCESTGLKSLPFNSGRAFLDYFQSHTELAGCIVTDFRMPELSGLELYEALRNEQCMLPVIMVTAHGDVPMCSMAIRRGVFDFLAKPYPEDLLFTRIAAALKADERRQTLLKRVAKLTDREKEIMELLRNGRSMKEIAVDSGTSIQTISKHRQRLLDKLEVRNDVELARLLDTSGWNTMASLHAHS